MRHVALDCGHDGGRLAGLCLAGRADGPLAGTRRTALPRYDRGKRNQPPQRAGPRPVTRGITGRPPMTGSVGPGQARAEQR